MNKRRESAAKNFQLVLLLLIILAGGILNSCGESENGENPNTTDGTTGSVAGAEKSLEELYPYAEHNFGGADINILARRDGYGGQDYEDLFVESETGEVLNDAVYKRNMAVEEKYNINIKISYDADPTAMTLKNIKAGDDIHQIIQEKLIFIQSTLGTRNMLLDLTTIKGINLDAPWYNQNAIKDLAILNKVTSLAGDITISDKAGVAVTLFNKKLAADYSIENLYDTVRQGKWTLEKLQELMKITSKDLNGDQKMTLKDDQWGLMAEAFIGWNFLVSSGNRLAALDDDGIPYITVNTPKFIEDLNIIMDILYDKENRIYGPLVEDYTNTFVENRNFLQINVFSMFPLIRGMNDDFGIIPVPKKNEEQKDYITTMSPWVSRFIAIPSTCKESEMTGAVIDAMSRESTDTIVPAYYDNLLNEKIARDDDSIEMLKMIFPSVIYDIGSVYNWGNLWNMHAEFIGGENTNYSSYYEKVSGVIQRALDKTIEDLSNQ